MRPLFKLLSAAATPLLTLSVFFAVLLLSRQPYSSQIAISSASDDILVEETATPTALPTITATPTPTPVIDPIRIEIPAIKVEAPMTVVGVLPDGRVEEPEGPDEVAWTTGGARPGTVGNAILSGHFDWSIPAPRGAVFFRLRELGEGDTVTIYFSDGSQLEYAVESSTLYLAATAPAEEILGPSTEEIITMITCEGTFDRSIRDYSHRRVVVAKRVY